MRILVTGGAGFIGSHIVTACLENGDDVCVLDSLFPAIHPLGSATPMPPSVSLIVGDVRDREAVDAALAGIDLVCHQAAKVGLGKDVSDLPDYVSNNSLGTAVLLAAMAERQVTRLVLASSMVVYGEGGYRCVDHGPMRPPARLVADLEAGMFEPRCAVCFQPLCMETVTESMPTDPRNAYAVTKLSQEQLAASWVRETGASAIALRYHNVYGPRMPRDTPYAGVAAIFRSSLERGESPRVFEDGRQLRDFVNVTDVADANLHAIGALAAPSEGPGQNFEAFNVASGEPHTIAEMAAELSVAHGGPAPIVTGAFRLGDVRHIVADPTKIELALGFRATTSWTAGIAEFADAPLRAVS
jgi:dTDP-L-rhamnose 4-epimerase